MEDPDHAAVRPLADDRAAPPRDRAGPPGAVVVQRAYDFLIWLIPVVDKLPRERKFTLGDRLESSALEVLESLTEAAYRKDRAECLASASRSLQRLRLLLRVATDLRVLDSRRYQFAAERLDEIGRMIGGWTRAQKGRPA